MDESPYGVVHRIAADGSEGGYRGILYKLGLLMAKDIKPRKTIQKERFEIVEYCISNSNNYALAAKEFDCSYSQVYTWVKKYKEKGIDGLADGRGRGKPKDELSDIEKLKAENRILKAEKKRQQMEIDLLKKLENIERR